MSKLDFFEEGLKDSIEGFEVPFNSSDWDKLNSGWIKNEVGMVPIQVSSLVS